jgi:hypothetical protein
VANHLGKLRGIGDRDRILAARRKWRLRFPGSSGYRQVAGEKIGGVVCRASRGPWQVEGAGRREGGWGKRRRRGPDEGEAHVPLRAERRSLSLANAHGRHRRPFPRAVRGRLPGMELVFLVPSGGLRAIVPE